MKKKIFLSCIYIIALSCWSSFQNPAVDSNYDFRQVGKLKINKIKDYPGVLGSGKMIMNSITYNFLKYGYSVSESDNDDNNIITIGQGDKILELSCIITKYTDSEMIIVPYRYEDRGYVKTTVEQSLDTDEENQKSVSSQSQSSTTTTHGGKVSQGKRVEYSQTKIGVMLKMVDQSSENLVWSNSYWYSGLEMQRTVDYCIKNCVVQIKKLFHK